LTATIPPMGAGDWRAAPRCGTVARMTNRPAALLALSLLPVLAAGAARAQAPVSMVCDDAVMLVDETRTVTDASGETSREWRVMLALVTRREPVTVTLAFRPPAGVVTTGPKVVRLAGPASWSPGIILGTQRLGRGSFPPKPPGGLDGLLAVSCAP